MNKNIHAVEIQEQYGDTIRERIRDQRGELSPMPGEPSIIAVPADELPNVGSF